MTVPVCLHCHTQWTAIEFPVLHLLRVTFSVLCVTDLTVIALQCSSPDIDDAVAVPALTTIIMLTKPTTVTPPFAKLPVQ